MCKPPSNLIIIVVVLHIVAIARRLGRTSPLCPSITWNLKAEQNKLLEVFIIRVPGLATEQTIATRGKLCTGI